MSDYEPDRHAEDEDSRLLEEYDACPENFRPVIETPRTDAATTDGWSGDAFATDPEVARDIERETALLRRHRNELAEACRWAQAQLGKHTRPSPIDRALAILKQLP